MDFTMTVEVPIIWVLFIVMEEWTMTKFFYDLEKLQGNPQVYFVDCGKLILRYDFRVQMYKAWKVERKLAPILQLLNENGLTKDLVGEHYYKSLGSGFNGSGFPLPSYRELGAGIDFEEDHPLLASGKYIRSGKKGNGLLIEGDFFREIENRYPEVSIEESLRMAGLDPIDVGHGRINTIRIELEKRSRQDTGRGEKADNRKPGPDETEKITPPLTEAEASLNTHPYVNSADHSGIQLKNAFYNEAYLLYPLGLERILVIFELPVQEVMARSGRKIDAKLRSWSKGKEEVEVADPRADRIRRRKVRELDLLVQKQFQDLGSGFIKMDMKSRRRFCRYLQELPRDTAGFYTIARIRELTGIPKSTYYAILNDENYGRAAEKRGADDEEDIELIRQVLAYKGYEKGIRQVYMLMPKVTGRSFSIHRIRRLMNKYGLRTTIRRPSRNRKAMKELIERNRKANLLMRRFRLHRPNEVRLTDVTYLDYGDGLRAYGSASVDPVTGRLICFIVSENNDLQLALDTLEAMDSHPAGSGAILHSDQGMLYMTDDFQKAVVEKELSQSMSRRGNCWDNAPQESFFGHFKDECHYEECKTLEELRAMIDGYAVYYNTERGMWEKERMTPEAYEIYLESMDDEQWAAYLTAEEERYLEMKKAAAEKAMKDARDCRNEIQEKLEELRS